MKKVILFGLVIMTNALVGITVSHNYQLASQCKDGQKVIGFTTGAVVEMCQQHGGVAYDANAPVIDSEYV